MNLTRPHKTRRAALAAALTLAALAPVAPTARANDHEGRHDEGAVLLECAGTVAASYSPGLTLAPRPVSERELLRVGHCDVVPPRSARSLTRV
ncbi:hypothetical protein J1792_14655 [Streptomyces triculaminicus]|uniref:Secreted protein n=2 Tax=Streptomyces TaxID=1883 RepID=A0A939FMI2_9ACTN|nr:MULTISPECIES: hypothetical protein [Streptomyces]MBO0653972.1 hypothetical protein [Streptomyces triculaminicus]QSY48718.1 hypothetical protein J3S04_27310 [Streptomyces griseocarneus]